MVIAKISRRRFVQGTAAGGIVALAQLRCHATEAIETQILETSVIPGSGHYCGWPTLTRRNNGELLLACSGGREKHVCPFGRVELQRSNDDGQTWSFPRVVMDGPIDDRDAGVLETANGSILITTFTSLAYEPLLQEAAQSQTWPPERLRKWQAAHNRISDSQRKAELGVWMIRSTDGGVTFSRRYNPLVNSPHGPIQLSDGRLLYAGKELWHGENRIGVSMSEDDGQTWHWLSTIPTRQGDNHRDYHELHAVESASGRIIVHIRNHNPTHNRETLQSESDDGGKTWSVPHSIGVWGLPSHLLRLADDRLVMSYGHRRDPLGNQARVSNDHGTTWSEPVLISADGTSGDLGYPSTVQLSNGELLTVWYERMADSDKAVLRQSRWKLS